MSIALRRLKLILLSVLIVIVALPSETFAQKETQEFTARNSVYLEIGGSSGIYAVNYSKIFHQKGKLKLNASAGFSMLPNEKIDSKTIWLPAIPLEVSALYGKSNHHLEMGFGFTSYLDKTTAIDSETFELSDEVVFGAVIPVRIGYRYQKPEGGFFFRVGYTPLFNVPVRAGKSWSFNPYHAGVSFGKSF
ncbi:hypothetical protein [Algoriphagus sp. A40]|uniref:hypothetical protein n=1 Tax=Algoriphagus sp. A40 TaxID=1945863 RepID=UPI00098781CE|nr:hypothetical protein [Algoriphagus sp. A40]OOG73641.1 hypothetical protein B0E43_12330 [Algoriphagus sp. A40]